jgi:hypothetical protein
MKLGTLLRVGLAALIVLPACFDLDLETEDPRVGELGRIRFTGGGCSGSTTMAVGSSERLTMEPVEEGASLPADLAVGSTEPGTIAVSAGGAPNEVVLQARQAGEAVVEVTTDGAELYDRLGFAAVPATRIDYRLPAAVLAGGTLALEVDEVYGLRDGEELALLGGGFLEWDTAPSDLLAPLRDEYRVALFVADGAGQALLEGREPSGGATLVSQTVTVVAAEDAIELTASMELLLVDGEVVDAEPLPSEVTVGALFQLQVVASTTSGPLVPVARFDLETSIEGDPGVLDDFPLEGDDAPGGPAFEAVGPGEAVVALTAAHLGLAARFAVTVTEAAPAGEG